DIADDLTARHVLAHVHRRLPYHVAVYSDEAVEVVYHHAVAEAVGAPAGPDYLAAVCRVDRRARADGDVQAIVAACEILRDNAVDRPDHPARRPRWRVVRGAGCGFGWGLRLGPRTARTAA